MSDAPTHLPHPISLPWAHVAWGEDSYAKSTNAPEALAREPLQISEGPAAPKEDARTGQLAYSQGGPSTGSAGPPSQIAPPPQGVPYRPPPQVPVEDRRPLARHSLVSLSVALDVLATHTRRIEVAPPLLQDLSSALAQVGATSGIDAEGLEALLRHAEGAAGQQRARLSLRLSHCAGSPAAEPVLAELPGTTTTPQSAADAMRRLEATAELVLREARLVLEPRDGPDSWQA